MKTMEQVRELAATLIGTVPEDFWAEPQLAALALAQAFCCVCMNADVERPMVHTLVDAALDSLIPVQTQNRGEPS